MAKEQFSKKDLEAVATDLNKIFEQPIPTGRKATIATLKKDLLEAAKEIQAEDDISDKSKEILTSLGAKLPMKKGEEKSGENPKKEKETPKEVEKKSGKKSEKKLKYSRGQALADALKKGGTRKEIEIIIDELYEKHGGTPNPKGAKAMMDIHFPILKVMGVVTIDEKGIISRV